MKISYLNVYIKDIILKFVLFHRGDNKSRLVREEDENDAIDDEERINMEINTGARDKEKIREAFLAAQGNGNQKYHIHYK